MNPRKLIWQMFPANGLTIFVAIFLVSWFGSRTLHDFYIQATETDLEARAHLIQENIEKYLSNYNYEGLLDYSVRSGRASGTRITVIAEDGKVLADSNEDPAVMENHRHRPEIATAFDGKTGISRRYSKTLEENRVYVAVPLQGGVGEKGSNHISAVLRTSVSVASLENALGEISWRIGGAALVVFLLAGVVTLFVSRNISRPLEEMTRRAERFARGDFSSRLTPSANRYASQEIITLATAMERMAELLDEKIEDIVTQRNQLETVFGSMVEAVIAIDREERIISLNSAASDLFHVDRQKVTGKIVQQVLRNVRLQQQISYTLSSRESIEDEIIVPQAGGDRYLLTNVVSLNNGAGEHIGVLVVMNDVTHLRYLESVRQDFVANVSHELRTPITSICGYVETLLDGALDSREDAEKFLNIVLRQSARLTSIIDDLLSLARIEGDSNQGQVMLEPGRLQPVIQAAVQTCLVKAQENNIKLEIHCAEELQVEMNAPLLEQAMINLVVNAIQYSEENGVIAISAFDKNDGMICISVADNGCGIGREHLPRLFERFYRSDKARSRSHGGTGLGLAIVKHIAQAHNGSIEVESIEGEGATFTLCLKKVGRKGTPNRNRTMD